MVETSVGRFSDWMKTGATPVRTTYDNRIEVLTPNDNRPVKSAQVFTYIKLKTMICENDL
jgi:hypothetical protein